MVIAGLGCRRGTDAAAILAAIAAGAAQFGLMPERLASGALKADEPGLIAAARMLGLPLVIVSEADLAVVAGRTATRSRASLVATGLPSLCEAAALAAAGTTGRLIAPRQVHGGVTVAFACTEELT